MKCAFMDRECNSECAAYVNIPDRENHCLRIILFGDLVGVMNRIKADGLSVYL